MICLAGVAEADQSSGTASRDIPAALAPLEFLVGSWKGRGVLKNNAAERFRGWDETHSWTWAFASGKPVAMSASVRGQAVRARHADSYRAPEPLSP
jgi:hypothetical protein